MSDDLFGDDPYLTDGKTETSRLAGETHKEHLARCELKVLDCIRKRGAYGATCDEVEGLIGMSHQTASARCVGLKRQGLIWPDGRKRLTQYGNPAMVLVAVKEELVATGDATDRNFDGGLASSELPNDQSVDTSISSRGRKS